MSTKSRLQESLMGFWSSGDISTDQEEECIKLLIEETKYNEFYKTLPLQELS